ISSSSTVIVTRHSYLLSTSPNLHLHHQPPSSPLTGLIFRPPIHNISKAATPYSQTSSSSVCISRLLPLYYYYYYYYYYYNNCHNIAAPHRCSTISPAIGGPQHRHGMCFLIIKVQ